MPQSKSHEPKKRKKISHETSSLVIRMRAIVNRVKQWGVNLSNLIRIPKIRTKYLDVEKFREYLTRNQIFFTTVAATSLTLMAVILSYGQLRVTKEQTIYLAQQTTVERELASPQFVLYVRQIPSEGDVFASDDKIFVYNQGNIARNVEVDTAVFLRISYTNKNATTGVAGGILPAVPISGYYTEYLYSGDATGLVVTIEQANNSLKYKKIRDKLVELAIKDDRTINDLIISRNVKISYQDIFNIKHTKYFLVHSIYGGELMEIGGEFVFEDYYYARDNGKLIDLDHLTAVYLNNLIPK